MPTLYQIVHGKFLRKNHEGIDVVLKAGDTMVPSPAELASDKFRLKPIGTTDWNSKEARAALNNTNRKVYPDFGSEVDTVASQEEFPQEVDDITTIQDVPTAQKIIANIDNEELLDKYLLQESDNKPRVRKSVITAIEKRRAALARTETATV